MLDPMDREELLEALRPEPGHAFDLGVGTSFSVDLEALMFAPLAFALFDVEGPPEPTALLAAIQQHAGRLALYCDRAQVRAPAGGQKLFALLEPSLLPVRAPRGGAFHPKLWVLRYRDARGGRRHRVLVLSRNLTHDTSWDLVVRFDEDDEGVPLGRDCAAALTALGELRPSPLTADLADSVAGARFALPAPFEEAALRLTGARAEGSAADPLDGVRGDRLLVVSPFLSAGRLAELRRRAGRGCRLVSRPAELERVGRDALAGWGTPLVLHEAAEPAEDAVGETALRGLHAKLVAVDRGERTSWFAGSMNATAAAVRRNVELCLELSGPRRRVGVGALLSAAGQEVRFRDLLREFVPENEEPAAQGPQEEERERLEEIAAQLAAMRFAVRVRPRERGYELELRFAGAAPQLRRRADRVEARLVTQRRRHPLDLGAEPAGRIPVRRKSEIGALVAVRLSGRFGVRRELVLFARLQGEPDDRIDELLLDLVPDQRRFALLLFLMLASGEPGAEVGGVARRLLAGDSGGSEPDPAGLDIPLYEELVRASARDRGRLDAIDDLVARLCRSAEGRSRLPDGFTDAWEAFRPLLAGGRR